MSLYLRISHSLREMADRFERLHRSKQPRLHKWEINKRAKQFVADHAHLDLDALTDLALKRGIYSSNQPRKHIRHRLNWMRTHRTLPPPSHPRSSILNPRFNNRELLKS